MVPHVQFPGPVVGARHSAPLGVSEKGFRVRVSGLGFRVYYITDCSTYFFVLGGVCLRYPYFGEVLICPCVVIMCSSAFHGGLEVSGQSSSSVFKTAVHCWHHERKKCPRASPSRPFAEGVQERAVIAWSLGAPETRRQMGRGGEGPMACVPSTHGCTPCPKLLREGTGGRDSAEPTAT